MKKQSFFPLIFLIVFSLLSCNLPFFDYTETGGESQSQGTDSDGLASSQEQEIEETFQYPDAPPSEEIILPDDLVYLGAFRLPEPTGDSSWDYSGQGLTYYPDGDPHGAEDGFPGSLFGIGHDHQLHVSEISIPEPVRSSSLDDLNTADTLQAFADITGGLITEELAIPVMGIEVMPPQGSQTQDTLFFCYGQHIQSFEPSHSWANLDLSNPNPAGPYLLDEYTNYVTNDYLFEIPGTWTDQYTPGKYLATGRFREGVWAGMGPTLFAYDPGDLENPPGANTKQGALTPLLLYGIQEAGMTDIISDDSMQMNGYKLADHWWGAAWLTAGQKSAVVFAGTKAIGKSWYGFANGVEWDYACAETTPSTCPEVPEWPYENRGYWAEDYQGQIIFYNPNDLALVAMGQMESFEPQPYAALDLNEVLFDPVINLEEYKRDIVGAVAFDRTNGYLYLFERLADEYKSVIHVWQVSP